MSNASTRFSVMILAAACALGAFQVSVRAADPTPAPAAAPAGLRIAVVNIVDLFDKLLEKTAADTDLSNMKKKNDEDVAAQNAELDRLKQSLGTYKEGSPQFNAAQDELLQKTVALSVFTQVHDAMYQKEQMLRTRALYKKIGEAVSDYAKANGIGLVFVADVVDMNNVRTPEALTAVVTTRKLLYFDPMSDITDKLVSRMNTDYQLQTPKK